MARCGFAVVLSLIIGGCATLPNGPLVEYRFPSSMPTTLPTTLTADQHVVFSFCKSLDEYATMSYREAARRFTNPVVVLCHGGTDPASRRWALYADNDRGGKMFTDEVAAAMAKRFPDRDIVFFSCNRDHHRINVPRVWYFTEVVWCMPDEDSKKLDAHKLPIQIWTDHLITQRENTRGVGCAGSIWEAITQNGTWR